MLIIRKRYLYLGEGPTQGNEGTKLTSEKIIQSILLKLTRNFV